MLNLLREGAKTVLDLIDQIRFFYETPEYEDKSKELINLNIDTVKSFSSCMKDLDFKNLQNLESDIKDYLTSNNLKFPQLGKPLRLILSGKSDRA